LTVERWADRFDAFRRRKEQAAAAAQLLPFETELVDPPPGSKAIGNAWTRARFDGDFFASRPASPDLPATSLVFVRSRDGNTVADDPAALGGGETDKHLVYEGLSRVAADAVIAGAGTIRGGDVVFSTWHPEIVRLRAELGLPRHPAQIVATLRGMPFEEGLIFNVPELRVVLLTVQSWLALMHAPLEARPWITPVVLPTAGDLATAFRTLRRLGFARISCVGGRTLAHQLVEAGLIQDVYLTTSAVSAGTPNTPLQLPRDGIRRVAVKHGTGRDQGVVFEHLAL